MYGNRRRVTRGGGKEACALKTDRQIDRCERCAMRLHQQFRTMRATGRTEYFGRQFMFRKWKAFRACRCVPGFLFFVPGSAQISDDF